VKNFLVQVIRYQPWLHRIVGALVALSLLRVLLFGLFMLGIAIIFPSKSQAQNVIGMLVLVILMLALLLLLKRLFAMAERISKDPPVESDAIRNLDLRKPER
jgi:hypothetical protein